MYRKLLLSAVFLFVLFGVVYQQPYMPATWLDEGFVLQGAMNLVRYGKYAMWSSEGFRVLDQPLVANGPGVVLPIAASFAIFGIGLLQARLVIAGFLLVFVVLYYLGAQQIFGDKAAIISLLLLLALPREGIFYYGRLALGNIPALAYFLAGFLLLLRTYDSNRYGASMGAGIFFGLAMVTKGQFGLVLPALVALAVIDGFYFKKLELKKVLLIFGLAVLVMGLWFSIQFLIVGLENVGQHLENIRSSSQVTVSAFRIEHIPANLWYLVRSGFILFVLPGVVYSVIQLVSRRDHKQLFLVVFILIWTSWNVIASVGWPRYLFTPYILGLILTANLLKDAVLGFWPIDIKNRSGLYWGQGVLVVGIVVGALYGLGLQIAQLFLPPDDSAQVFARYLEEHVEDGAVVESWEWQLDVLGDVNYHHPPNNLVDLETGYIHYGDEFVTDYDPFQYQPDYLITGPFSKGTKIYSEFLMGGCCRLVYQSGLYDLYKVTSRFYE